MIREEWKEHLYRALQEASKRVKIVQISKESGIPKNSLYNFNKTKHLGPDHRNKLEKWLVRKHYLYVDPNSSIDAGVRNPEAPMNPWPRIAEENRPYPNTQARASALFQSVSGDLHSLADTISNEALPGPHRLDVLKRRIALITETLAQWPEDPD